MNFGLSHEMVTDLRAVCCRTKGLKKVLVYGSRARGDFNAASDLDLAIDAPDLSDSEFAALCHDLTAVPMIFKLDIVRLDELTNATLRSQIERDGLPLL